MGRSPRRSSPRRSPRRSRSRESPPSDCGEQNLLLKSALDLLSVFFEVLLAAQCGFSVPLALSSVSVKGIILGRQFEVLLCSYCRRNAIACSCFCISRGTALEGVGHNNCISSCPLSPHWCGVWMNRFDRLTSAFCCTACFMPTKHRLVGAKKTRPQAPPPVRLVPP